MRVRASAFCPCKKCTNKSPGDVGYGVTASGRTVTANGGRFVAADRSIPFGTMIDVPGYGVVPVLDRGGAIKGNRLDVYYPTHKAARRWGARKLWVTINRRRP